jgi:ATP-binding cassette subfamily C protein
VQFFDHLRRLIAMMRWRALAVLALLGATGLVEGTGLLLLIPLLGAIGLDIQQGSVGRLASLITATFLAIGLTPTLPLVLTVFVLVNVLLAWLRRTHAMMSASVERDVAVASAERLYSAIARMDWLSFARLRGSDLTVALTSGYERMGTAASHVLSLAGATIVALVYIGLAFRISPVMTMGVFACGLLLLAVVRRRTHGALALGTTFSDALHDYQAAVADDLAGMKTIRSFVAEDRSRERVVDLARRLGSVRRANIRYYANSTFWLDVGSVTLLSVLVFVAIRAFHFEVPALLMLLFLFARVVPRLMALQQNIEFYINLLPSLSRHTALEAYCVAAAEQNAGTGAAIALTRDLTLDRVSFRYAAGESQVLTSIALSIAAGSTVAIVGPSGAGKTTLVDLMLGLLTPTEGTVAVDGAPLVIERGRAWRSSVSYVPQDTFLFHDTIRANLRWAVPGATDADLAAVLSLAAAEFALDLPQGLDTVVGDRGVRLSGGERQRIALARALLRRPSLLILDEATSALDSENETRIFEAIQRLHGTMTIVVITHRVSTVSGADVIHVLEAGQIVESGSWDSLMSARNGRFRELCRAQGVVFAGVPAD